MSVCHPGRKVQGVGAGIGTIPSHSVLTSALFVVRVANRLRVELRVGFKRGEPWGQTDFRSGSLFTGRLEHLVRMAKINDRTKNKNK